ncbi:MAG TPA: TolC family protein, partial [Rhodanobacteraceae bacterium]|nr:TolC family protein [Rhodanobacteraceae bacterium]
MRKPLRLNLLAAALAWACAPALVHAEDLVQIYQQARNADPTLAIADANKGSINEGVDQARSALLPQIGASLSYDHSDGGFN